MKLAAAAKARGSEGGGGQAVPHVRLGAAERAPGLGQAAAAYATGPYAAQASRVAGHDSLLWIDTMGSDPAANVLDVEPGDATPWGATQWVKARLTKDRNAVAIVYTMRDEWQEVKDGVATLPSWMQSKVRYWIADPTGYAFTSSPVPARPSGTGAASTTSPPPARTSPANPQSGSHLLCGAAFPHPVAPHRSTSRDTASSP